MLPAGERRRLETRLQLPADLAQTLADLHGVADERVEAAHALFDDGAAHEQIAKEIDQIVQLAQLQTHVQIGLLLTSVRSVTAGSTRVGASELGTLALLARLEPSRH